MAAASASLALAACGGGGDSTVTQQQPAPELPPGPIVDPDFSKESEEEPVGPPMPFAGLGLSQAAKGVAATALREVADTNKVQLAGGTQSGAGHPRPDSLAIQGLQLKMPKDLSRQYSTFFDRPDVKTAQVIPSGSGDNIAYSFGLYTPEFRNDITIFSTGLQKIVTHSFENEIFSLSTEDNDAFTSVERVESIATQLGEGWDYSILKASVPSVKDGDKDATLYAELWTDVASAGESDYMVGGWWLLVPDNPTGDYHFGALSKAEKYYTRSNATGAVKVEVTGPATYKGNAAGLHTSSENGMVSIQRLLGKVTLTADFGDDQARGTIKGEINSLTLNGDSVGGEILLPEAPYGDGSNWASLRPIEGTNRSPNPKSDLGNIKGINYRGDWAGTFQGDSSGTAQPTGIVGVVGGSGGGNSFVASFGAKKVEAEE